MHSQPTNLPTFKPGDVISNRTLSHVTEITKGASISHQGLGLHGNSTSSGTSYNLDENLNKFSIWAMITGVRRKYPPGVYPSLEDPECPEIAGQFGYCYPPYNPEKCPNYWYAYSWSELNEDYNILRYGSEIFQIREDPLLPSFEQPPNNVNKLPTGEPLDFYPRSCRRVQKEYSSAGGMFGYIHDWPLYEVNNQLLPKGMVLQIHKGHGNYMLAQAHHIQAADNFSWRLIHTNPLRGFLPVRKNKVTCSDKELDIWWPIFPPSYTESGIEPSFSDYSKRENLREPGKLNIVKDTNGITEGLF